MNAERGEGGQGMKSELLHFSSGSASEAEPSVTERKRGRKEARSFPYLGRSCQKYFSAEKSFDPASLAYARSGLAKAPRVRFLTRGGVE